MAWKSPNRPNNEITQQFSDGVVKIYTVKDMAKPGYRPEPQLSLLYTLRYNRQRVGLTRLYLSKQAQAEIQEVLRVPLPGDIPIQSVAVLENGRKFQIETVQSVDNSYPACVDLSLTALKQTYEVIP